MITKFIWTLIPVAQAAETQEWYEFLGLSKGANLGDLLASLYRFALGLVGIAALAMLIVGGVMYMTAGDSQDQTKRARGYMTNAVFGLVLALLSWLVLFTINPDLVRQLNLGLTPITLEVDPQIFAPAKGLGGFENMYPLVLPGEKETLTNITQAHCTGAGGRLTSPVTDPNKLVCVTPLAEETQRITGFGSSEANACRAKPNGRVVQFQDGFYCSVPFK